MVIAGAIVAFVVAVFVSSKAMNQGFKTRASEWNRNEESGPTSRAQQHWTMIHIRDDLGGIAVTLAITNGLLAAILAALLLR